jgi:suppressor of G2 allele of SKP1
MSTAEAFFEKANSYFVDENFDDALVNYNKAVEVDPTKPDYFVKRATCHIKLNSFTDAITDAAAALKLQPNNANAYLRKGMALFSLEEYETAKQAFEKGQSLDPSNSGFKTWIRKCDAELQVEGKSSSTSTTTGPKPQVSTIQQEGSTPTVPTPLVTTTANNVTNSISAPPPSSAASGKKMRYEWYQNQTHVTVSLFVKNVKKEQCKIDIKQKQIDASIDLGGGSEFNLDLDLCDTIIPEEAVIQYLSTKVEIKLRKANGNKWETLEAPIGGTIATRKWDDASGIL